MHWFFNSEIIGDTFETSREESRHISKVLRMVPGDEAVFTDGVGNAYHVELIDNHPKQCSFRVKKKVTQHKPADYHLHLAVAPTKNISRFEWFLEKATEIGIDEITPVFCDHSERLKLNVERLNRVLIAALKQSQQVWLPILNEPRKFKDIISTAKPDAYNYIAWVSKDHDTLLKSHYRPGKDATILIGPEGDFSSDEIEMALASNFIPISLGDNRLRTETAALVACHTIVLLNQ